jgi:hypothetical protein
VNGDLQALKFDADERQRQKLRRHPEALAA